MPITFTINGTLVSKSTKEPLSGLRVEAWDKDLLLDDLLGNAITDENGKFKITFWDSYFKEIIIDSRPDVFFRVYDGETKILDTREHYFANLDKKTITVKLEVEMKAKPAAGNGNESSGFSVGGKILSNDEVRYQELIVEAFDVDLRRSQLLGKCKADASGNYFIPYSKMDFVRAEKELADLRLRLTDKSGKLLKETEIIFNAPANHQVDLTLGETYRGISEFAKLLASITPLLDKITINDLTEDDQHKDISFLSAELDISEFTLEAFIASHRLHTAATVMPKEFYYALLRNDVPTRDLMKIVSANPENTVQQNRYFYLDAGSTLKNLVGTDPQAIEQILRKAVSANQIPARFENAIADWMIAWKKFRAGQQTGTTGNINAVSQILSQAGLPKDIAATITSRFISHEGLPMTFWDTLKTDPQIKDEHIEQASAVYRLAELIGYDNAVAEAVLAEKKVTAIADVRELAKMDDADWKAIAKKKTGKGKTEINTDNLAGKFEKAFPTSALVGRLRKDKKSFSHAPAVEFFHKHFPEKELHRVSVNREINEAVQSGKMKKAEADTVKSDLLSVQRVFKLAPVYSATKAMMDEGIHSAQTIYAMGADNFAAKMEKSGAMTKAEAEIVFAKAEDTYAVTLAIVGDMNSIADGGAIEAMPEGGLMEKFKAVAADFPNLNTLFQTIDSCACDHCRSVYSPAAYLADQLRFLKHRASVDLGVTVKDVLFERRPDIGEVELSCANANVPMPFIDLVCEILENAVDSNEFVIAAEPLIAGTIPATLVQKLRAAKLPVTDSATVTDAGRPAGAFIVRDDKQTYLLIPAGARIRVRLLRQTHLKAEELKAIPEYINDKAYEKLKSATLLPTLPFDLNWMTTRGYLSAVETDRYTLMELFHKAQPDALALSQEYFGFSKAEGDLIVNPDSMMPAKYWGNIANIAHVDIFLNKTGIDYVQLQQLLACSFVNPNPKSEIIIPADGACDTSVQTISNLSSTKLDLIHRFLRLSHKLGWTFSELNAALMNGVIGAGNLNPAALNTLSVFAQLRESFRCSTEELLLFYGLYDINRSGGIYERNFLNPALTSPVNPDFLPENMKVNTGDGNPLDDKTRGIITAGLNITADELSLLTERLKLINGNPVVRLNQTNLAFMHRNAILAKALHLDIRSLLIFIDILDPDILTIPNPESPFVNPNKTRHFADFVLSCTRSGLSADELAFLLMNSDPDHKYVRSNEDIAAWLLSARTALIELKESINDTAVEGNEWVKIKPVEQKALLQSQADKIVSILQLESAAPADVLILNAQFGTLLSPAQLNTIGLLAADATKKPDERFAKVREFLAPVLFERGVDSVALDISVSAFGNNKSITESLLGKIEMPAGSPILDLFHDAGLTDNLIAINEINFPVFFQAGRLLGKVSFLIQKLKFDSASCDFILDQYTIFGLTNLNTLPLTSDSGFARTEPFSNLLLFTQLNKSYPAAEGKTFVSTLLLTLAGSETNFLSSLAAITSWNPDSLNAVKNWFTFTINTEFRSMSTYPWLAACINAMETLKANIHQIELLIVSDTNASTAALARDLAKSHFEEADWLDTSATVQDIIRPAKRDALVAWLIGENGEAMGWNSANDLYSYYLIDVEMGACEITTRVLQAGLSVQLFVQRCLIHLEEKVIADSAVDRNWLQWKWMKNYRVWEANRKVFLYPENWIEPELRPDKSYFFKEMENQLSQNDLTKLNAEVAYGDYLEKLDNVARLDVCGMHYEESTYTYYVFGRTSDDPQKYFWRKWIEDRYWTPWEKIDMEIKSDYGVTPVIVNNRLFLYWMEFVEKARELNSSGSISTPALSSTATPQAPTKYYEIHLTSTEFRNKKWQPKQVSKSYISTSAIQYAERSKYVCLPFDTTWMPNIPNGVQLNGKYFIGIFNTNGNTSSQYVIPEGFFELGGCHGSPEIVYEDDIWAALTNPSIPFFDRSYFYYAEDYEAPGGNKSVPFSDMLTFKKGASLFNNVPMLYTTPGRFRGQFTMELSAFDRLMFLYHALTDFASDGYPYGTLLPVFYEDKHRTFMMQPELVSWEFGQQGNWQNWKIDEFFYSDTLRIIKEWMTNPGEIPDELKKYFQPGAQFGFWPFYRFRNFYHPFVCFFTKQLAQQGIDGLMDREVQLLNRTKFNELTEFNFAATYLPTIAVNPWRYPKEDVDFEPDGSYSSYNWELFFHVPFYIATRLSANQRFEEAMEWFHYIFNPTDTSSNPKPQKYWITKPFFERTNQAYIDQRIDQILGQIHNNDVELIRQVRNWRNNPFQPHLVAQFRTVAYQKAVFMKYIDNLIAWGDSLFRQDTREAINEASQYYVMAAELLGQRPRVIPKKADSVMKTFNQLESGLDAFSNALLDLENVVPSVPEAPPQPGPGPALPSIESFYFCLPPNEKLLGYWDTISDRLFKIRNCMNIDGETRSLALFSPPIDPALLVKAAAAGLDISSVLADLNAPLPVYRYSTTQQKAKEFTNEVKALGTALLQAIEKKDAEAISLLRSTNEMKVLNATRSVRLMQIREAKENRLALDHSMATAKEKLKYYTSREFMNSFEKTAFELSGVSIMLHTTGTFLDILGGALALIPDFDLGVSGFGGSPKASAGFGGSNISKGLELSAKAMYQTATILDKNASMANTQGSYKRRMEDWNFQAAQARHEISQLKKQMAAADIRLAIAEKELANTDLQIDNAKETDQFMRDKFSNEDLYEWMKTQISTVYFQSYKLALDMSKRAERCFRYEIGKQNTSFIQPAYWDSLHKGLLSGEKLTFDLNRMDAAYIEQNRREHEMNKHVSLALLDPAALIRLREEGFCEISIPEALFDLECPGHYFRRIKTISLSIPCVAGPYTSVNCKLSLLSSRVRTNTKLTAGTYAWQDDNDNRFEYNLGAIQSIVTSNAQNDSGLFESNLRDERYLPFEGQGAVSRWKVELLGSTMKGFDFGSITDVVLNLRYTARYGGDNFRAKVNQEIETTLNALMKYAASDTGALYRLIPLRYEMPTEWHRFLNPPPVSGDQNIPFGLGKELLPYVFHEKNLTVNDVEFYVKYKSGVVVNNFHFDFVPAAAAPGAGLLVSDKFGLKKYPKTGLNLALPANGKIDYKLVAWKGAHTHFDNDEIEDVIAVIRYSVA